LHRYAEDELGLAMEKTWEYTLKDIERYKSDGIWELDEIQNAASAVCKSIQMTAKLDEDEDVMHCPWTVDRIASGAGFVAKLGGGLNKLNPVYP
jgi:hypothetical protein